MPPQPAATKRQHAQRSVFNYAYHIDIRDKAQESLDWWVTVLFYSALHAMDAYLISKGKRTGSHEGRDEKIAECLDELAPILPTYTKLKTLSNQARYKPHMPITASDLDDAENYHRQICKFLRPLVGEAVALNT